MALYIKNLLKQLPGKLKTLLTLNYYLSYLFLKNLKKAKIGENRCLSIN